MLVSGIDGNLTSPVSLSDIFKLKKYDKFRLEILKDLNIVANYLPQVNSILSWKGEKEAIVSLTEFSNLLIHILPVVRLLGVSILLPKSLKTLVYPNLYLQLKKGPGKQESVKSLVGLTELLDYDWQVTLGDTLMDVNEFLKMVKGLQGLVKLKDQYIFLDEAQIKALQKNLEKNQELSSYQLIQAALAEEVAGATVGLSPDVAKMVKEILKGNAPEVPSELQASLRPYQLRGFEWMARNAELGMGSIIADDMGLGKTLQVITLLLHFKTQGYLVKNKALVVVPTSLISNWEREIARFAPSLNSYAYHGSGRTEDFKDVDVVITSYGMVRNNPGVFDKHKWHTLIVDEAQNIKNPSSEQTKAIKKIKAETRIAMSGTPVENRLSEYWSIFDFSNKGYLGNYNWFNEEFSKPIQQNRDMNKVELFRRITAPFLLRRMKTDKSIITDLPDKVENSQYASLSSNQAALYQNLVDQTMNAIENSEGIERKGLVLKLMMALKQIGNHPYQYLKQGKKEYTISEKSQLALELVESIIENDEKVLIFTQFREMGELLSEFISTHTSEKPLFLHGGCSRKQRDEMVDKFQNHHPRIFILSLKAGGTGLNLTAASHVIHYDLWWNPAVESQATDRAFRIGQKKNVIVSRLINKGTIEEKIDKMIQEKRALADLTVATGETWLGNLSNDEIKNLVKLEI
jgi:SNF2 family DNA or RNA helicase